VVKMASWLSEWSDDKNLQSFNLALALIALAISFFLFVNVKGLENISLVFLIMSILGLIAVASDGIKNNQKFLEFYSFGKSLKTALLGLIIGLGLGLLVYSTKTFSILKISTPVLTTSALSSLPVIAIFDILIPTSWIITCLLSPITEELFFRQTVYPTLSKIGANTFTARIVSIILTSAFFGFMHYFAYGANFSLIVSAFIFSLIVIVGNFIVKSIAFGLGLHFANNLVAYMGGSSALLLIIFAVFAGLYLVSIAFDLKKILAGG